MYHKESCPIVNDAMGKPDQAGDGWQGARRTDAGTGHLTSQHDAIDRMARRFTFSGQDTEESHPALTRWDLDLIDWEQSAPFRPAICGMRPVPEY